LYISEVKLHNIKCFGDIYLNLEEKGEPILWTMVLGDNAVGKTCLLRSIALGLCDQASAAALMKELPGEMLRKGKREGFIYIKLRNTEGETFSITTEITKKRLISPERITQRFKPREDKIPWDDIFLCGYGPQRAAEADRSFIKYLPLEAVYTLFNYSAPLQNPEIIFWRQEKHIKKIENKLLKILMLDKRNYSVKPSKRGLEIIGPWGTLPVEVLSDGYRSTTNWVLDFFAWQIYAGKLDGAGILLVDEIEQHLHPLWQRYIVERLSSQFPRIQFITTTHTPLIALGISEIKNAMIIKLEQDKNKKIIGKIIPIETLRGMRADQALTSEAFGLATARSITGDKLERFHKLYLKDSLDKDEEKEFKKLRSILRRVMPEAGETAEDRRIQRDLRKRLMNIERMLSSHRKGHD